MSCVKCLPYFAVSGMFVIALTFNSIPWWVITKPVGPSRTYAFMGAVKSKPHLPLGVYIDLIIIWLSLWELITFPFLHSFLHHLFVSSLQLAAVQLSSSAQNYRWVKWHATCSLWIGKEWFHFLKLCFMTCQDLIAPSIHFKLHWHI